MRFNSISRKLVITIVLPIVTILMTLGVLNYWDTKGIITQLNTAEHKFIQEEIKSFIELQFVALDIIEEPIEQQMENYSNKIINDYYNGTENIESTDLNLIQHELGMNADAYDLYVINTQGEVVNTTYENDLGINLFNFGEVYKKYLQNIIEQNKFDSPKFFFEDKTKKYKKYSYQATPDKKYIIEIGLYSNQADRIFAYMMKHLEKIKQQRNNLSAVDLFFWLEEPTSLDQNVTFIEEHKSILPDLESSKKYTINASDSSKNYNYLYVENINSKLIKGAIVRLTNNHHDAASFDKKELSKFIAVLLVALVLTIIIAFLIKPVGKVIKSVTIIAKELAVGNLAVKVDSKLKNRKDELGDLATAIETLVSGLNQTAEFARQTGKGNLNEKYTLLSDKDVLGQTLMRMQKRLTRAKNEEEKNLAEEKKNKFIADGLAKFAEILRANNSDIEQLCKNILNNLTEYIDVPVAALFVAKQTNGITTFEAKATIAYSRFKLLNKEVHIGEGLVGRCAFEKQSIYLTDIPEDYIQIRSGFGASEPKHLFFTPLIYEDEIYGVIEIAALQIIEEYKISFIEKLAESIASTLSSVKLNQQTIELLEQSKQQSNDLSKQEEEMRLNMEELFASQEEGLKREEALQNKIELFENSVFKTEYNMAGVISYINNTYISFLNIKVETIKGKQYTAECNVLNIKPELFNSIWIDLKNGKKFNHIIDAEVQGSRVKLKEFYYPVLEGGTGTPIKIIKISHLC